ncbi:MAG: glycoside hydrolase family 28 protein [Fimbriimonadales bacterium]
MNALMETGLPVINVRDFNAVPDGKNFCTRAIQQAIDKCASGGGGTVYFPPGVYLSGTLYLKSHVALYLEANATLLGGSVKENYPVRKSKTETRTNRYNLRSLIFAEDLENIAIQGRGTLDGNGGFFKDRRHDGDRPLILRVINCKDVLIEGITMQNSGFWNQHFLACDRVRMHGVRVWNHATYNVDAIDIDGCRDFIVSDCFFDSDDDAVCLKGTSLRPCERIQITNCTISSHCNAIKMGTDSSGGFMDITISNCSITSPRGSKAIYGFDRGISGISLELVDGGKMERIAISNVTIDGVEVPIFVRLGARGSGMFPTEADAKAAYSVGTLRDVSFSNIIATRAGLTGCPISGIPGHEIENLTLSNVSIRSEGGTGVPPVGVQGRPAPEVPEFHDKYPEGTMFGKLPAHGLFCRHVRGLSLDNVRIETDKPDGRHALVLDDVQDASIDRLRCAHEPGGSPLVRLDQCRNIAFRNCDPKGPSFLRVEGSETSGISLIGNDLSRVTKAADLGDGVATASLKLVGNL